jgi:hypothetical protein
MSEASIKVFDLSGRKQDVDPLYLPAVPGQSSSIELDVTNLSEGIYILHLQTNDKEMRVTFMRNR